MQKQFCKWPISISRHGENARGCKNVSEQNTVVDYNWEIIQNLDHGPDINAVHSEAVNRIDSF